MRILVADDELAVRDALGRALSSEGYDVAFARDGRETLAAVETEEPDAAVLDVMMPPPDGLEVCRRLRAAENALPILMLTARRDVSDRVAGLDAGADDYLPKPFALDELLARLRAMIRRGPYERGSVLEVGDLRVEPATRVVSRAGREVDLSPREFAVLEFLARHAGQTVSRSQLLEHVWAENAGGSPNVVDVYVGYLRRKLEQPFGRPLIRTIRGVGFALDPDP
jgi:DNA-binding response OmpR family regulator